MELELDKKEFERIQQELIQATVENITLEYFEYEGKKWLNEDFVIPISVIQNKIDELEKAGTTKTLNNKNELTEEHYFLQDEIEVLQELLEERNK